MRQANVMNSLSTIAQGPGRYIHWGVIQISVANFAIIAAMVVLFVLALIVPFPSGHGQDADEERRGR
jgi:large-conductance mechanosensitive channel